METHFSSNPTWSRPMAVNGQGLFAFNIKRSSPFLIIVTKLSTSDNIMLVVGSNFAEFGMTHNNVYKRLVRSDKPRCGLDEGRKISYWFSYNRDSLVLKYGKGYTMEETIFLEYDFLEGSTPLEQDKIRKRFYGLFNAEDRGLVQLYDCANVVHSPMSASLTDIEKQVSFRKNPFICNLSPIVLDSSELTLLKLNNKNYMMAGSLPAACKEMFYNIRKCELDLPPEMDGVFLSDAIRFSMKTEGCLLYEKLKEKAGKFGSGSGAEESYLRVTLGHSLGNSPGIPYILEIWPSKHYSPIHNHGNANAIIKVLFGQISISIYNKQTTDPDASPLKTFTVSKGDVTWINKDWFQTHRLWNNTNDFCTTIQCYSYDADDTIHWPYFEYVSKNRTIERFLPNSDFTFTDMRQKILDEYRLKCNNSTRKRTSSLCGWSHFVAKWGQCRR